MFKILAATKNKHKIEEFRYMLAPLQEGIDLLGACDIENFPDVIEDGKTYEENAAKKAIEASIFAGIPSFADDSGLEVEALNGEPGIYSARYAGENASNAERIAKLLKALEGKENRKAKFVCVIAIANNGKLVDSFRGEVSGRIIDAPRGAHGFGYDPVFIPDGYEQTFAEMDSELKDKISHRAKAVRKTLDFVEEELSVLKDLDL